MVMTSIFFNTNKNTNNKNNNNHSLLAKPMGNSTNNYSDINGVSSSIINTEHFSSNDLQKIVSAYFEKKGYSKADLKYLQDAQGNTISMDQLVNYIKTKYENNLTSTTTTNNTTTAPILHHLFNTDTSDGDPIDPDAYTTSYKKLREWITKALDIYKVIISY